MGISIQPVNATLGAVVTGLRLTDLTAHQFAAVLDAFHEHAVLVFPGQHLAAHEQREFASRFGPISTATDSPQTATTSKALPRSTQDHGAFAVANLTPNGELITDADDPWVRTLSGNFEWHTDSSYLPVSAKVSMLTAHAVPSRGGQTEWADMRAAYDDLDQPTRDLIAKLSAYHSFTRAQSRLFPDGTADSDHLGGSPLRPIVKSHAVTGRKALYIGRHAFGIDGLEAADSERLLNRLLGDACRPPRVYSHRWSVGDLVIWDNRSVLHRGRPWDVSELRHLTHSRVAGDPATESAGSFG